MDCCTMPCSRSSTTSVVVPRGRPDIRERHFGRKTRHFRPNLDRAPSTDLAFLLLDASVGCSADLQVRQVGQAGRPALQGDVMRRMLLSVTAVCFVAGFIATPVASAQQSVNFWVGAFAPNGIDVRPNN